jgi:SAM-dependent methyltransferase
VKTPNGPIRPSNAPIRLARDPRQPAILTMCVGSPAARRPWLAQLDGVRNAVRQELITVQLAAHPPNGTVLDVGCGQGTQAIRLAERGCVVTGVDPSQNLLNHLAEGAATSGVSIEAAMRRLEDLDETLGHGASMWCACTDS